jgi:hypothetical protein
VSSLSIVVDVQFRQEEVSSTSSGSSTVLNEQNRPEGVSSTAFGDSELGVIPDSCTLASGASELVVWSF